MTAATIAPAAVAAPDSIALGQILSLSDPIGVLTIYADADPALRAGGSAWQAPVRVGLRRLVKEARRTRPREERLALEARLAELEPDLEALLDPRAGRRGRALFAAVDGREAHRVELREPVPALVHLGDHATALPLLAAVQEGRAAGVATVSWDRLESAEWALGALSPLGIAALADGEPERQRAGTNPAVPQPFPERDRFATAAGARVLARLREVGARLGEQAESRGWDILVADGDPRLVEALAAGVATAACELVQSRRPLGRLAAAGAADRVGAEIVERRGERVARLVEELEASAAATCDALVLRRALAEGRVEQLLLRVPPEPSAAQDAELLARRAFATGAAVTLVGDGAGELGSGGAAALLRW